LSSQLGKFSAKEVKRVLPAAKSWLAWTILSYTNQRFSEVAAREMTQVKGISKIKYAVEFAGESAKKNL
jgi:hypothetical protein